MMINDGFMVKFIDILCLFNGHYIKVDDCYLTVVQWFVRWIIIGDNDLQ